MKVNEPYPSDLSDEEWEIIRRLLPERGRLGRPPRYSRRRVLEAILYVARSGIAWRMLPNDFPHWRLVYYYFAKWQKLGVWEQLNGKLRDRLRALSGKKKPRAPRSSTARACAWLAREGIADLMRERRWTGANGICWSTPSG